MKDLFIGNTDHDWFNFCKENPHFEQVNFWQPSIQKFKALEEGGIFFFRLKSPINKIGGFGTLASAHSASIGLLWDDLGQSNGVQSQEELIERVRKYRKIKFVDRNTQIGFKILIDQVFLDEKDWFDLPEDWSPNIVRGKGYSSETDTGRYLLEKFLEHSQQSTKSNEIAKEVLGFSDEIQGGYRVGSPSSIRVGQQAFRALLISVYDGKCAVTDSEILESLDAAHIVPFSVDQNHHASNGILLRCDIHALLDEGLIFVDSNFRIQSTEKFKDIYPNSTELDLIIDRKIRLPDNPRNWPRVDTEKG